MLVAGVALVGLGACGARSGDGIHLVVETVTPAG